MHGIWLPATLLLILSLHGAALLAPGWCWVHINYGHRRPEPGPVLCFLACDLTTGLVCRPSSAKKVICKFWWEGRCTKGTACPYAHGKVGSFGAVLEQLMHSIPSMQRRHDACLRSEVQAASMLVL